MEDCRCPEPTPSTRARFQMFNVWIQGNPERRLPSAAAITTRGSSKNPSFTVILNACRVANELCWFKKKKKGKHKSKDMDKAQESPGPHWVRPGGGRVDGRWCRQGKSIQQMVYITDDWQFRVSSQFLLLLQPKEGTKRRGKVGH